MHKSKIKLFRNRAPFLLIHCVSGEVFQKRQRIFAKGFYRNESGKPWTTRPYFQWGTCYCWSGFTLKGDRSNWSSKTLRHWYLPLHHSYLKLISGWATVINWETRAQDRKTNSSQKFKHFSKSWNFWLLSQDLPTWKTTLLRTLAGIYTRWRQGNFKPDSTKSLAMIFQTSNWLMELRQ